MPGGKYSSLLRKFVTYVSKKFYNIGLQMGKICTKVSNKIILYIKVNLCVCVFGIEIHTVGPILTKFGMGA